MKKSIASVKPPVPMPNVAQLVDQYLRTYGPLLKQKRAYLHNLSGKDALLEHIWDYGRFDINGKTERSRHFLNNAHYVKTRDEIRETLRQLPFDKGQNPYPSFGLLYKAVYEALRPSIRKGIGQLTRYDITWYIAAFLGLYPAKVYCQRSASKGAFALKLLPKIKDAILPYDRVVDTVPEFAALAAEDIENFLCIYADDLFIISVSGTVFVGVDAVAYQRQMRGYTSDYE